MRVADGFRGTGVGRALLRHIVAEARERGMTSLWLETGTTPDFAPGAAALRERGVQRVRAVRGVRRRPVLGVHDPDAVARRPHAGTTSATAKAATPSPAPVNPSPSVVVAETETDAPPSAADSAASASTRRAANRGRLACTCTVTLPMRQPGLAEQRQRAREERVGVRRGVLGTVRPEVGADVAESRGRQQRIDDRVRDGVAVGVTRRAPARPAIRGRRATASPRPRSRARRCRCRPAAPRECGRCRRMPGRWARRGSGRGRGRAAS